MSSCPRVSGSARSSSSIRLPLPRRLLIESPAAPGQPLAQTPRPNIGPVLFDVVQTRSPVGFAVNPPPAGWNIGEDRPQAVLLLVVDQDEKAAIVVVKRIDAHQFSRPSNSSLTYCSSWPRRLNRSKRYWRRTGSA